MPDHRAPVNAGRRDPWGAPVAGVPHVEERVRRLSTDRGAVEVDHGPPQTASVHSRDARVAHPVTLRTCESEPTAAVTAIGGGCREALRPDQTVDSAGSDLLLVHLDEVVAPRDTTEPLRITADGLQGPTSAPSAAIAAITATVGDRS